MHPCSQCAPLWATADFVPRSERWGAPRRHGLCSHPAQLWATSDFQLTLLLPVLLGMELKEEAKLQLGPKPLLSLNCHPLSICCCMRLLCTGVFWALCLVIDGTTSVKYFGGVGPKNS